MLPNDNQFLNKGERMTLDQMNISTRKLDMARDFYGYGRWDARYWFIGPEQGKGPKENSSNARRLEAWLELGKPELCDCKAFHEAIGETTWDERLQSTWKQLILLLMIAQGNLTDRETRLAYQRARWGRISPKDGETLVIELSGLAAKNLKAPGDRNRFRQERIKLIRGNMLKHEPKFVVMYGRGARRHWEEIAGCELNPNGVVKCGATLIAFTTHPVAFGIKNSYWEQLGQRLR